MSTKSTSSDNSGHCDLDDIPGSDVKRIKTEPNETGYIYKIEDVSGTLPEYHSLDSASAATLGSISASINACDTHDKIETEIKVETFIKNEIS